MTYSDFKDANSNFSLTLRHEKKYFKSGLFWDFLPTVHLLEFSHFLFDFDELLRHLWITHHRNLHERVSKKNNADLVPLIRIPNQHPPLGCVKNFDFQNFSHNLPTIIFKFKTLNECEL